ncbi:MAG: AmmeMemoRadiSam system protein B, partial [Armatimonadota bacterium]|nr:AmmeMemoRadiSam system protein B [Armatimonadota bacterium]
VAGMFYAGDEKSLREQIETAFFDSLGPGRLPAAPDSPLSNILGIVSPHAGYMYSGSAAATAFHHLAEDGRPDVAIILGPNHRGLGAPASIMEQGSWETPLGEISIDENIAASLLNACPYIQTDSFAHRLEHSLEVQVPFLQYVFGNKIKIVPVTIAVPAIPEAKMFAKELGSAIASTLQGASGVVIASTDMTHYESKALAWRNDAVAIEAIEDLNAEKLIDTVSENGITMCGAVPVAVAVEACKLLGAAKAELLQYYTSGDITGDDDQVVGYAAMKMIRNR